MNENYTLDKLLGSNNALSYEDLSVNPNLIVIGAKNTGKTNKWAIPNARWINSRATIITDRGLHIKDSVDSWYKELNEDFPLRQYIFDADREDTYKFNPFTSDIGDSTKKVRHLARAFLAASKDVPQKEDFYALYTAIVCAVYFGVTSEKNDLEGLMDTMNMEYSDFKTKMSIFIKDSESTYSSKPSFLEWLSKFNAIPVNKGATMFDIAKIGLDPFFTKEALRMSDTHENTVLNLDIQAYHLYVNLKDKRYDTTNCMFGVFLDAVLDRHIFFSKNIDEERIVPYKHFIIDDADYIPLSPHVRKNMDRVSKLGVTTTVLSEHAKWIKSFFDLFDNAILMGGTEDEEDISFFSETFGIPVEQITKNNDDSNVLIFQKGKELIVDHKLGDRGIF